MVITQGSFELKVSTALAFLEVLAFRAEAPMPLAEEPGFPRAMLLRRRVLKRYSLLHDASGVRREKKRVSERTKSKESSDPKAVSTGLAFFSMATWPGK